MGLKNQFNLEIKTIMMYYRREGGGDMPKEEQIGFTLRINAGKWALFTAIAALKRTSAVAMIRDYIDQTLEENKALINVEELEKVKG
jgi:hypothetical protein